MTHEQYFGGKVLIKSLQVTDQPANRSEVQARLLSPGGELAVLADGVTAIRHLAYIELRQGKPRGNHFHKLRHETFYLIHGEVDLRLKDLASDETVAVHLRSGDLAQIAPEVVHLFLPMNDGHAVEFAPEPFDLSDVYRHVLA